MVIGDRRIVSPSSGDIACLSCSTSASFNKDVCLRIKKTTLAASRAVPQ